MSWVEFIEALARVADLACVPTPVVDPIVFEKAKQFNIIGLIDEDNSTQPLDIKIQNIMPLLMSVCSDNVKNNFVWSKEMPFF